MKEKVSGLILITDGSMKRYLMTQMKNEWKENIWLLLELIIVSVTVWYLVLMMTSSMTGLFLPRGFEYEDVYIGDFSSVRRESPEWVAPEDTTEDGRYRSAANNIRMLFDKIRSCPYVEGVAAGSNALPYNYNYYGLTFYRLTPDGDTVSYGVNARSVTPEMPMVLRYRSLTGQTHAQMRDVLEQGEVLFAPGNYPDMSDSERAELRGTRLYISYMNDQQGEYRVGGLINPVRRTDYEDLAPSGTIIIPVDETNDRILVGNSQHIAIRVKPRYGARLMEEFRNNPELSHQGNIIINDLRPLETVRTVCQWSMEVILRQYGVGILCLFIIVFLGLLGTFWFRVQQRVGEIAIRKVSGATSRDIFRRMVGESMLMVSCATVVAWVIDYALIHFGYVEIYGPDSLWLIIGAALAVLILLVLAVLAGVWLPARNAMKIEPAVALKTE